MSVLRRANVLQSGHSHAKHLAECSQCFTKTLREPAQAFAQSSGRKRLGSGLVDSSGLGVVFGQLEGGCGFDDATFVGVLFGAGVVADLVDVLCVSSDVFVSASLTITPLIPPKLTLVNRFTRPLDRGDGYRNRSRRAGATYTGYGNGWSSKRVR